jgi:uncharacterized membrane-anchored protein YjiN (DUF445 family)
MESGFPSKFEEGLVRFLMNENVEKDNLGEAIAEYVKSKQCREDIRASMSKVMADVIERNDKFKRKLFVVMNEEIGRSLKDKQFRAKMKVVVADGVSELLKDALSPDSY